MTPRRWLRVTPYERSIPGRAFVEERFPLLSSEAEAHPRTAGDPGAFLHLEATASLLKELRGEEDPPEATQQHGALLFHVWHLWRNGEPHFLLEEPLLRRLAAADPPGGLPPEDWQGEGIPAAGYLQFPVHRVWIAGEDGDPPESLDGFFWTRTSGNTLSLLFVSGILRDRPGLSVFELPPLPLAEAGAWARGPARGEDPALDFTSTLPGGAEAGMISIETGAEALKLVARILRGMEACPEWIGPTERSPDESAVPAPAPEPSRLPWRRIAGADPAGGGGEGGAP